MKSLDPLDPSHRLARFIAAFAIVMLALGCSNKSLATQNCGKDAKECAADAINAGRTDEAYVLMLPIANGGDAEVQVGIALLLISGQGTVEAKRASKQERELLALPWIRRAAIAANEQAIIWLADGYKHGWFGFKIDPSREKCLRSAAAEGESASRCLN